jgi:hypothetical protein
MNINRLYLRAYKIK